MGACGVGRRLSRVVVRRLVAIVPLLIVWLLLSTATPPAAHAQELDLSDQWRWTSYRESDGLPSDAVVDLVQATDGVVWVATEQGLAWSEGYGWHTEGLDGLPARSPADALLARPEGGIWVVLEGDLYQGDRSGFERLPLVHDGAQQHIVSVQAGNQGLLLLARGGEETPVRAFFWQDGRLAPRALPENLLWRPGREAESWRSERGTLWLSTWLGPARWEGDAIRPILESGAAVYLVGEIDENPGGSGLAAVLSGPRHMGLWEWGVARAATRVPEFRQQVISALEVLESDEAIVATEAQGLWTRSGGNWKPQATPLELRAGVRFIRSDAEGDLWFGTEQGLFLYRVGGTRWSDVLPPETTGRVWSFLSRGDETWVGTENGLFVLEDGQVRRHFASVEGLRLQRVNSIAEDADGRLWIANVEGAVGVYRWDGTDWRVVTADALLGLGMTMRIRPDAAGGLWFLGFPRADDEPDVGALHYDGQRFWHWGTADGLPSDRVYDVAVGRDGEFWFGTDAGLSRWRKGAWSHWTINNGLRSSRVYDIAIDGDGAVWFDHNRLGLGSLVDDTIRYLGIVDGLPSDSVYAVEIEPDGRVWVATQNGIACIRDGVVASFTARDGLDRAQALEIEPNEDRIWLGAGPGGLKALHRDETAAGVPRIDLAPPRLQGDLVALGWSVHTYRGQLPASRIETRYRIDAGAWSAWDRQDQLHVHVGFGEHTLEVQAKGLFGDAQLAREEIRFQGPMPFYLRGAFVVPFLLSLALVGSIMTAQAARKRQAQALVAQARAHYAGLMEEASDAFVEHDEKGTIQQANGRFADLLGRDRDELIGRGIDLLPEHLVQRGRQGLAAIARSGEWHDRWEFGRDDQRRVFDIRSYAIDRAGTQIHTLLLEVTHLEAAVEETRRWSEVYAKTGVGVAVLQAGKIEMANAPLAELLGYEPDDLLGRGFASLLEDSGRPATDPGKRPLSTAATSRRVTLRRADATTFPALVRTAALGPAEQDRRVSTVFDLTAQVEANRALRRQEQLTLAITEASLDQVVVVDSDGLIRYLNRTIFSSVPASELIGSDYFDALHTTARAVMEPTLREVFASGEPATREVRVPVEHRGRRQIVECRVYPVFEAGRVAAVAILTRDITEDRRSTRRLRQLAARLTTVREQERTSLSRDLHDQLGQELTALKMDVAWLRRRLGDNESSERLQAMGGLVDGLIRVVRQIVVDLRPPMLDELQLRELVEWETHDFCERHGLRCSVSVPADEVPLDDDRKTAVFRILQEALTNVAKHAQASTLAVMLRSRDGQLQLRVADNGVGRAERRGEAVQGLGIVGMRERATALGGNLTISDSRGGGTRVVLRVPLAQHIGTNHV